jgi:hypothetical protein
MGEPFDLGVDGWDRLVGEFFGGTGEGAHARYQLLSDARSWDDGLESSVKWRGTDKVGATSLALAPAYARCLPEDALPQGASRSLGSACQAHARRTASGAELMANCGRCEPATTMAIHSWRRGRRGSGAVALRFAPGHVAALIEESARSPVTGQTRRVSAHA